MANQNVPNKMVFMPTWLSLPSTWDASVSDVEMLQGILYNVNCIIQYLNDLQLNYESYTDNAINALRSEITQKYDAAIADLKQYYDNAIDALYAYIDTQDIKYWSLTLQEISRIDTRINNLQNYVDTNFADIRANHTNDINNVYKFIESTRQEIMAFIELNNQTLKEWVENTYEDILDKVDEINEDGFRVLNPTTGEKDRIENTILDVYNALRIWGITASEFDLWFIDYNHNGNDFRYLNMSALDFDTKAWWIMYQNIDDKIISPVTGEFQTIPRSIEEVSTNAVIASPTTGNLSAQMWDALEFDQQDYEVNYVLSAYQYDFSSIHMFDNTAIEILSKTKNGYIRNYSFEIENNGGFNFDVETNQIHLSDILSLNIIALNPDTITSIGNIQIKYTLENNYVSQINITTETEPEDTNLDSIFISLILANQPIKPVNISGTYPPKPVPMGGVNSTQWDNYFDNNDGNDFKILDMSAYTYDTNSIQYMVKEEK